VTLIQINARCRICGKCDRLLGAIADSHNNESGPLVSVIKRQSESRRRYLPIQFPLMDSAGTFVYQERRQLPERRKQKNDLDDLKIILSKIYSD
jgi:hypothetical protein